MFCYQFFVKTFFTLKLSLFLYISARCLKEERLKVKQRGQEQGKQGREGEEKEGIFFFQERLPS